MNIVRGIIMRDTNMGAGIVFVNDAQKSFTLEAHWKSALPPKVGSTVEIHLDASGEIMSLSAIDETTLAKEQAEKALIMMKANSRNISNVLISRMGLPTIITMVILFIAWTMLSTLTVNVGMGLKPSITFWELLKLINTENILSVSSLNDKSSGIYGLIAIITLIAPFIPNFLQDIRQKISIEDKFLHLLYAAPLIFMTGLFSFAYYKIYHTITNQAGSNDFMSKLVSEMISMTMKSISMGMGFYVSFAAAGFLAFIGLRKFLASHASIA